MPYLDHLLDKTKPAIKGKMKDAMVSGIMDRLADWRLSPFEFEAACVAGLRSGLCLQGHSFSSAEKSAFEIVQAGLMRLGAARPKWEEGQREYVIAEENCRWCGGDIPEDLMFTKRSFRYCSSGCACNALRYREFEDRKRSNEVYYSTVEFVQRGAQAPRDCEHCGKKFRPWFGEGRFCTHRCSTDFNRRLQSKECPTCKKRFQPRSATTVYCSTDCQHIGHRQLAEKACAHCGEMFRPRSVANQFCSRVCVDADKKERVIWSVCEICETPFTASRPARLCSKRCESRAYRQRTRPSIVCAEIRPKVLTPAIFDGFFAMAA